VAMALECARTTRRHDAGGSFEFSVFSEIWKAVEKLNPREKPAAEN
jgi:hypothetical protein